MHVNKNCTKFKVISNIKPKQK